MCTLVPISGLTQREARSGNLAEHRLLFFIFPDFVLCYLDGFQFAAMFPFNLEPSVLT